MEYAVGYVRRGVDDDIARSMEELEFQGFERHNFDLAIAFAEGLAERNKQIDDDREIVVASSRAIDSVSRANPELTVLWSSKDDPVMLREYLHLTSNKWAHTDSIISRKSDRPSIYFDLDGALSELRVPYATYEELMDPANHCFRKAEPHPYMEALMRSLQSEGRDVCIICGTDRETMRDKIEHIDKYFSFIPKSNVFFAPVGADKSQFVKSNAEISVLVSTNVKSLDSWKGRAVKAIDQHGMREGRYPEFEIKEEMGEVSQGHVLCSAKLLGDILDYKYDNSKDYYAQFLKEDPVYKYAEHMLNEIDDNFTLEGASYVLETIQMGDQPFTRERKAAVEKLILDRIDAHAIKLIDDEIERYPCGYKVADIVRADISGFEFGNIFHDYCEMVKDHKQRGEEPPYGTFRSYFNAVEREKLYLEDFEDHFADRCFKYHMSYSEWKIVDSYLARLDNALTEGSKSGNILSKELKRRGFAGVDFDVEFEGVQRLMLTIKTDNEMNSDRRNIVDMFARGDVKALKKSLAGMTEEEQLAHFDNAVTYLMYQQGHSLTELAEGYLTDAPVENAFVKSIVEQMKDNPDSSDITAFIRMDGRGLDALDRIADGSSRGITLSKTGTTIGLDKAHMDKTQIELNDDVTIPANMVSNVVVLEIDEGDVLYKGEGDITRSDNVGKVNERLFRSDVKQTVELINKLGGKDAREKKVNGPKLD